MKLCENCIHFHYAQPCDGSGAGYCDVDYRPTYGGANIEECEDYREFASDLLPKEKENGHD